MGTTVRSLEPGERDEVRELLNQIHVHTETCARCQQAVGGLDMCTVGLELYSRWADWLTGVGGPH